MCHRMAKLVERENEMTRKYDESIKETQAEIWCQETWDCQEACLPSGPEHYAQIDGVCVVCGEIVIEKEIG